MSTENTNAKWLTPEKFGPLWQYIEDEEITNVDWDAGQLWIQKANHIREAVHDSEVTNKYMEDFSIRVGNECGSNFNKSEKSVIAETETLRIVCLHPSFALSGVSVCIRKSLPKLRFNTKMALDAGFCDEKVMHLLINCVLAHKNFIFGGEPGKGKTESAKFFSSFIPANNKVITVEDVREWHYKEINPGKSCIELKVNGQSEESLHMGYERTLNLAVRLNPSWIMVAETRGREARYLLEAWTNGVANMTTLHVKGVKYIPERIVNMIGNMESNQEAIIEQIYNNVGIGVQLDEIEIGGGKTKHLITEVGFFYRKDEENHIAMIVEDGIFYEERMPAFILKEIERKVGHDPYTCDIAYTNYARVLGMEERLANAEINMEKELAQNISNMMDN